MHDRPAPSSDTADRPEFVLEEWDDAPLCREIFVLNNLMLRTGEHFVSELGLTSSRWLLLGAIDDCEQAGQDPTVSELSQNALLLSVQNISRMVQSFEEEGLVERYNVPGRGRSVFVKLTDAGRDTLHRACARGQGLIQRLHEGLSEREIEQIRSGLTRLVANLERLSHDLNEGRVDVRATDPGEHP